jgi:predicted DNA binding CopG/RHH family protein
MKNEYDLSKLQSRRNPYSAKLKKSVTLKIGEDVIDYFKSMASEVGVPYNNLINLYLRDCVAEHRKVNISWNNPN